MTENKHENSTNFNGKQTTVADLIAALNKFPPDTVVISKADNFELRGSMVPVSLISEYSAERTTGTFKDAFDGESFRREIYGLVFDKDNKKAIKVAVISF